MTPRPFVSLIDAATPPVGYVFGGGVWLTHDIDYSGITLGIAPALAGCESPDPQRRLDATRRLDSQLLVIAQWGRVSARPPTSKIDVCWGPPKRVQHAKVALLRYDRKTGSPLVRALVTSANVTAGGLSRNLELLAVEDSDGTGDLAGGVADALSRYRKIDGLPSRTSTKLRAMLTSIRVTAAVKPSLIVDSMDRTSLLGQISGLSSPAQATELTIVDPGFASGAYSKLANELRRIFPSVTSIKVIAQESLDGRLMFPIALGDALCRAFKTTPTYRSVNDDRMLHAKAISWAGPDGTATLLGSANFTASGLLGDNIELGVVVEGPSIMSQLRTRTCSGAPDLTDRAENDQATMPLMTASGRVNRRDRKRHTLTSTIEIELHGGKPPWSSWKIESLITESTRLTTWRHDGNRLLLCRDLEVEIDEDNRMVWVVAARRSCCVPIDLTGYEPNELDERHEVDDPIPPTIAALLAGQSVAARPYAPSSQSSLESAVDVLAQPDASLVYKIAIALIRAAGSWSEDDLTTALEQLERDGRLTSGERWALHLLVERPAKSDDPDGYRIATLLEKI